MTPTGIAISKIRGGETQLVETTILAILASVITARAQVLAGFYLLSELDNSGPELSPEARRNFVIRSR
jgi:hypothetical protein